MKNSFLARLCLVILVSLLFLGCRKEILRDENNRVITPNQVHCYNGVLDEDEIGIDCGGADCEPCNEVAIPCSIANNTLVIGSSSYSITSINSSVSGGDYVITAVSGTRAITINVINPPATNSAYGLDYPTTSAGQGVISITNLPNSVSDYIYYAGNLYFNVSGGGYKVSLCGGSFWNTFGSTVNVEFTIIVP